MIKWKVKDYFRSNHIITHNSNLTRGSNKTYLPPEYTAILNFTCLYLYLFLTFNSDLNYVDIFEKFNI